MAFQSLVVRRHSDTLAGYSCWLRRKVADILGHHPSRVPTSPESGKVTFDEDMSDSSIFSHPNSDIGLFQDGLRHDSPTEGDFASALEEEHVPDTVPELAAAIDEQPSVPEGPINFSRPLVGRPSRGVAIGLVDWPQDDELAHLIDSFPSQPGPSQSTGFSSSELPEAQNPDEEAFFRKDDQPHHVSFSVQSPSTYDSPTSNELEAQNLIPKPKDHIIKRKPVPQRVLLLKSQRFPLYLEPRGMSPVRGSLQGLVRFRKIAKGELPPLPEIKRLTLLMESFKIFGLGGTGSVASSEGDEDADACDAEISNNKGGQKQLADSEPSGLANGTQPPKSSASAVEGELCSDLPDSSALPNPLHSYPASLLETSYAHYLTTHHQSSRSSSSHISNEACNSHINSKKWQEQHGRTARTSINTSERSNLHLASTASGAGTRGYAGSITTEIQPADNRGLATWPCA